MTTINCSSNCIHQIDGKCTLDNVTINSVSAATDCIHFQEYGINQEQNKP